MAQTNKERNGTNQCTRKLPWQTTKVKELQIEMPQIVDISNYHRTSGISLSKTIENLISRINSWRAICN
jgi:hypothetical protein